MKAFIDNDGNIIGLVLGALPDIEDNITIENTNQIIIPEEVAKRIEDPTDNLNIRTIKFVDGAIEEKTPEDIQNDIKQEENIISQDKQAPRPPTLEELQSQIDELKKQVIDVPPS